MLGAQLVASIIEILPENHADPALNSNQRKGLSYYDRQRIQGEPGAKRTRNRFLLLRCLWTALPAPSPGSNLIRTNGAMGENVPPPF